eukprot:TRINITY_DN930_c0_g1_i1.p1 TRINITY_DN930_c0_g1~~TRINITY_DN930_c0_g1_i1.p1  ORF type:complete len:742 (-),score=247.24 TRINITY_DN930_c0_g1_i1:101-2326(-)
MEDLTQMGITLFYDKKKIFSLIQNGKQTTPHVGVAIAVSVTESVSIPSAMKNDTEKTNQLSSSPIQDQSQTQQPLVPVKPSQADNQKPLPPPKVPPSSKSTVEDSNSSLPLVNKPNESSNQSHPLPPPKIPTREGPPPIVRPSNNPFLNNQQTNDVTPSQANPTTGPPPIVRPSTNQSETTAPSPSSSSTTTTPSGPPPIVRPSTTNPFLNNNNEKKVELNSKPLPVPTSHTEPTHSTPTSAPPPIVRPTSNTHVENNSTPSGPPPIVRPTSNIHTENSSISSGGPPPIVRPTPNNTHAENTLNVSSGPPPPPPIVRPNQSNTTTTSTPPSHATEHTTESSAPLPPPVVVRPNQNMDINQNNSLSPSSGGPPPVVRPSSNPFLNNDRQSKPLPTPDSSKPTPAPPPIVRPTPSTPINQETSPTSAPSLPPPVVRQSQSTTVTSNTSLISSGGPPPIVRSNQTSTSTPFQPAPSVTETSTPENKVQAPPPRPPKSTDSPTHSTTITTGPPSLPSRSAAPPPAELSLVLHGNDQAKRASNTGADENVSNPVLVSTSYGKPIKPMEPLVRPKATEPAKTTTTTTTTSTSTSTSSTLEDNKKSTNTFLAKNLGYDESRLQGDLKCKITSFTLQTEGAGLFCKKYAVFTINVTQEGESWTIFRRYSQLLELDKKLKDHGLLSKSDKQFPAKTTGKRNNTDEFVTERMQELQAYLDNVINSPEIRSSLYVFNVIRPFQLGDIKPVKK